jgi:hypothetical protein
MMMGLDLSTRTYLTARVSSSQSGKVSSGQ